MYSAERRPSLLLAASAFTTAVKIVAITAPEVDHVHDSGRLSLQLPFGRNNPSSTWTLPPPSILPWSEAFSLLPPLPRSSRPRPQPQPLLAQTKHITNKGNQHGKGRPVGLREEKVRGNYHISSAHACMCALFAHEPPADVLVFLGVPRFTLRLRWSISIVRADD